MLKKIGIYLIFLSFVPYLSIFIVPFLPLSGTAKAASISILVVMGEIMFWGGGIIVGKEVVSKYRRYFNPRNWFADKTKPQSEPESGIEPKAK